jgi:hypothetical protein
LPANVQAQQQAQSTYTQQGLITSTAQAQGDSAGAWNKKGGKKRSRKNKSKKGGKGKKSRKHKSRKEKK